MEQSSIELKIRELTSKRKLAAYLKEVFVSLDCYCPNDIQLLDAIAANDMVVCLTSKYITKTGRKTAKLAEEFEKIVNQENSNHVEED